MAGLVPAIYDFVSVAPQQDMDARIKSGHDIRLLSISLSQW